MWHLATPFLVFFSFLDSTIIGHVTQISDFLHYRKIKVVNLFFRGCQILKGFHKFSQSYDHYKILCKLASGHANMFALSIWYCSPIIEEHVTDKPGFLVVLQSAHA